jgi:hypothetical protein
MKNEKRRDYIGILDNIENNEMNISKSDVRSINNDAIQELNVIRKIKQLLETNPSDQTQDMSDNIINEALKRRTLSEKNHFFNLPMLLKPVFAFIILGVCLFLYFTLSGQRNNQIFLVRLAGDLWINNKKVLLTDDNNYLIRKTIRIEERKGQSAFQIDQSKLIVLKQNAKFQLQYNSIRNKEYLNLIQGTIVCHVDKSLSKSQLIIDTGDARFTIIGTTFFVAKHPQYTELGVQHGTVKAVIKRKEYFITNNSSIQIFSNNINILKVPGEEALQFDIFQNLTLTNNPSTVKNVIDSRKRFIILWKNIHDPKNGYFSDSGIPYHSIEKFIIDSVDYGHHSTSETITMVLWLDILYAKLTKDWNYFFHTWDIIEKYFIPSQEEQPNVQYYNPLKPSSVTPVYNDPHLYPVPILRDKSVGADPLYAELDLKYGKTVYLMHELLDTENWFQFKKKNPVKIQLFGKGPRESIWQTVPHPSFDEEGLGLKGYADLYIKTDVPQWSYASDNESDMQLIQAMYWALQFAHEQNVPLDQYISKTKKLSDFLRYGLYHTFFQTISSNDDCHYLLSRTINWGGSIHSQNKWSWRLAYNQIPLSSQNPVATYFLIQLDNHSVWQRSLPRQLELYEWLQSKDGCLGDGVEFERTNIKPGPFHGLTYQTFPDLKISSTNEWVGSQYSSIERLAEYYYITGNGKAKKILQKWMSWIDPYLNAFNQDKTLLIPSYISFKNTPRDIGYTYKVLSQSQDTTLVSTLSLILIFWNKGLEKWENKKTDYKTSNNLLEYMWSQYYDQKGVAPPSNHEEYEKFWTEHIIMPDHDKKIMPWGKVITSQNTFNETRPDYKEMLPPKGPYSKENPAPAYNYHVTSAQCRFALALAYSYIFEIAPPPF